MTAIEIQGRPGVNGTVKAVVSEWVQSDGSVRFVMTGLNGGAKKICKTLNGAMKAAHRYVGL